MLTYNHKTHICNLTHHPPVSPETHVKLTETIRLQCAHHLLCTRHATSTNTHNSWGMFLGLGVSTRWTRETESERTVTSPKTHYPQAGGDLQSPVTTADTSSLSKPLCSAWKGNRPWIQPQKLPPLPCTHLASLPAVINLAVGETGEMGPWART